MNIKARQTGFTLIELLVTISVAAVLLMSAAPDFVRFILDNRQAATVNQMVSSTQIARSEAITRNRQVTVCITNAAGDDCPTGTTDWASNGWLVFVDNDGDEDYDAGETILQRVQGSQNYRIAGSRIDAGGSISDARFLAYLPSGRADHPLADDNTNLTFCDSRGAASARVVIVPTLGRQRVGSTNSAGQVPTCL